MARAILWAMTTSIWFGLPNQDNGPGCGSPRMAICGQYGRNTGPMVPDEGIEPPTFGLQNRCSTAELIRPTGLSSPPLRQAEPKVQPSVRAISRVMVSGVHNSGRYA